MTVCQNHVEYFAHCNQTHLSRVKIPLSLELHLLKSSFLNMIIFIRLLVEKTHSCF